MKIVFITSNHYLDSAVPLINSLSKYLDILVIVNCLEESRNFFFRPDCGRKKEPLIEVIKDQVQALPDYAGLLKPEGNFRLFFVFYKNHKILSPGAWRNIFSVKKYLDDAEIIHVQTLDAHNYFALNGFANKKIIIDIHDIIQHSGSDSTPWSVFIRKKWLVLADQIIVHNLSCLKYLNSPAKNKTNVLPFGLIPLTYRNNLPSAERGVPNILFFGRICQYKGIEYLIEAAQILKKSLPDFKVTIAGHGNYDFGAEGIKDDPKFQIINRYISNEELAGLINKSTFVVCPYTDATQSGVIMTAFACEKPVVATSVGSFPEVIEDNLTGRIVPPKDSKKLAEAFLDLLINPEKINIMKENIKKKYCQKNYSWDYIARKTIDIYKK